MAAPTDLGLATAGVCAAIMLAACQDGAAQFLAWPNGGMGVAGAIAVRGASDSSFFPVGCLPAASHVSTVLIMSLLSLRALRTVHTAPAHVHAERHNQS